MEISEVVMNPVRQRIIQYLMVHERGTVKEIKEILDDIPTPSLYRHVKILAENDIIVVAEENRVWGTVENIYELNPKGNADRKKDMYSLTSCTLMLTDEEFQAFMAEINEVGMKYVSKSQTEGCKPRQITLVSSPIYCCCKGMAGAVENLAFELKG